jgi:hypothetical protein
MNHNHPVKGVARWLWIALVSTLTSGCASDYVYLQMGKSEAQVRQDYTECVDQQQYQFASAGIEGQRIVVVQRTQDTSACMESKGYRTVKIEAELAPDKDRRGLPNAPAFLPQ